MSFDSSGDISSSSSTIYYNDHTPACASFIGPFTSCNYDGRTYDYFSVMGLGGSYSFVPSVPGGTGGG